MFIGLFGGFFGSFRSPWMFPMDYDHWELSEPKTSSTQGEQPRKHGKSQKLFRKASLTSHSTVCNYVEPNPSMFSFSSSKCRITY